APIFVSLKIMNDFTLYLFNINMFVRDNILLTDTNTSVSSGSMSPRNGDRLIVPIEEVYILWVSGYIVHCRTISKETPSEVTKALVSFSYEYFDHQTESCQCCYG
ncbi:MAG: hypothetical protein KTM48_01920, partial [Wolbachia endosymbiont of Pissodes strobi]|nr:hypothetical protein [Wolbachia endosymbiont of Pissodes strobi]